jgi:uncharacterized OB-fold protein
MIKAKEYYSNVYSEKDNKEVKCNSCGRVYMAGDMLLNIPNDEEYDEKDITEYCPNCHSKDISQLLNIEIQSVEISKNYISKDMGSPFIATRMAIIQAFTTKDVILIVWLDCNKHNLDKRFEVVEIFTEAFQGLSDLLQSNDYEHWKTAIEDYIGNECMDELMDY